MLHLQPPDIVFDHVCEVEDEEAVETVQDGGCDDVEGGPAQGRWGWQHPDRKVHDVVNDPTDTNTPLNSSVPLQCVDHLNGIPQLDVQSNFYAFEPKKEHEYANQGHLLQHLINDESQTLDVITNDIISVHILPKIRIMECIGHSAEREQVQCAHLDEDGTGEDPVVYYDTGHRQRSQDHTDGQEEKEQLADIDIVVVAGVGDLGEVILRVGEVEGYGCQVHAVRYILIHFFYKNDNYFYYIYYKKDF